MTQQEMSSIPHCEVVELAAGWGAVEWQQQQQPEGLPVLPGSTGMAGASSMATGGCWGQCSCFCAENKL